MDSKKRISVWAGILTLLVFAIGVWLATDQIDSRDLAILIPQVIGTAISFVVVYFIIKWLLTRYFKGKSQPQPTSPKFGSQQ